VYSVLAGLLPAGVVTTTLTAPAAPAGVVAVMVVALTTETPVAAAPPKVTPVAPVKPVPAIVTLVPPAIGRSSDSPKSPWAARYRCTACWPGCCQLA